MLFLIGLGLGDAKDITLNGLEIVKKVGKVYLENYTSILSCGQQELEELYGRSVILADREMIEQECQEILDAAETESGAALLVVGDPMNATTHTDLLLRAASRNIPYRIIHNASIVNAVACCGLQIYNFGETASIPFWTETWQPDSFYDKILRNKTNGLHTLCLLDIKVKEPNLEMLMKGIKQDEPPRFMTVSQAADQLINTIRRRRVDFGSHGNDSTIEQISLEQSSSELKLTMTKSFSEEREKDSIVGTGGNGSGGDLLSEDTVCIGLARVGSPSQLIVKTTLIKALDLDMGAPLHSLVIPGTLHPLEEEILNISVTTPTPTTTTTAAAAAATS
uniref:diphthine methyl ester synthase n=1 Tax=Aceria tosichella TaxID=561515 RepID=A0A6G1SPQ9_9ACAR